MVAPVYTTDLTIFDAAAALGTWNEATGYLASAAPDVDTDLAIYGSSCITADRHKTGLSSVVVNPGTVTVNAGEAFFVWHKFFAPNSLNTKANGGVRILIGNSLSAFYAWYVDGSNTYPYGGWKNYAVDPNLSGLSGATQGTPDNTWAMAGCGWNSVNAVSKGNPMNVDIIRYGRGEVIVTDGDLGNGYATFDGIALVNDNPTTGQWGLFQDVGGSYLWKGLISLGTVVTSVDFRDANVVINIENTEFCDSDFNRIEVTNASSNVEWTGISISALGIVGKGNFQSVDNATIAKTGCTFNDMGTFIYNGGANANTLTDNTWRRCQKVSQGSGIFDGCAFINANDSAAFQVSDSAALGLANLTNCTFSATINNHAVKLGPIVGDITRSWDGHTLVGYGTGTTGTISGISGTDSAAIEVNVATGSTLNLNIVNGADVPTVQNLGGGDVVITAAVTVSLTGMKDASEARIYLTGTTTELAGVEDVTGGVGTGLNNGTAGGSTDDNSFTFSTTAGTGLDIRVFNVIDWISDDLINFVVPAGGASIPIAQRQDRVFSDPA